MTDKKVSLFIVGARKCATTSLANHLNNHPEISLSKDKEPEYFSKHYNTDLSIYNNQFDWTKNIQLDASTGYTAYPEINVAERIYKYNPSAKIIYLIRDPIERIKSHYKMSYEKGDLEGSINNALLHHKLLIDCTRYGYFAEQYISKFGQENILFLNITEPNTKINTLLENFINLKYPLNNYLPNDNVGTNNLRLNKNIDTIIQTKLWHISKAIIPKSALQKFRKYIHKRSTRQIDFNLNNNSIKLLQLELMSELAKFEKITKIDLGDWIRNLEDLQPT